ncbi:MAG: ROK family protein [Trueperaceae bacterium]
MILRTLATAKDDVRRLNQSAVFQVVHRHGPVSRVDIAARLNLSPATVTNITSDLIDRGLVFEARKAERGGVGRRRVLLEVAYDTAYVAGIKVSNVGLTCALTNLNAEVVHATQRPLASTEPGAVVDAIEAAFADLGSAVGQPLAALGVNLPGLVDADRQTVRHSPLLGWSQVPLGQLLHDRLGVSVLVENDVNALALAEAWFGRGREHDGFLVVTLGRGVGLGIVINGEVYRGPHGGAGEFGHVLLDPNGPETRYAAAGTVEAFLSDDALVREARRRVAGFPIDGTAEFVAELAHRGDAAATGVVVDAGRALGRALSVLVNVFAPSLIVLSGEGMRAADVMLPAARDELGRLSFGDLADRVELAVESWGDDAWARGAAALAASRYLTESAMSARGD